MEKDIYGECLVDNCNGLLCEKFVAEDGKAYYYCNICGEEHWECPNCGELMNWDWLGDSELAIQDGICKNCMEDGYGK